MGKRRRGGEGSDVCDAALAALKRCCCATATPTSASPAATTARRAHPLLVVGLTAVTRALQRAPPCGLSAVLAAADPRPVVGHLPGAARAAGVPLVLVRGGGAVGPTALAAALGWPGTVLAVGLRAQLTLQQQQLPGADGLAQLAGWLRDGGGVPPPPLPRETTAPAVVEADDVMADEPPEFMG